MTRYEKVKNPHGVPCEFTGRETASTWYYWVEPADTGGADEISRCLHRWHWYAGGETGRPFKRKLDALRERAETEGFKMPLQC